MRKCLKTEKYFRNIDISKKVDIKFSVIFYIRTSPGFLIFGPGGEAAVPAHVLPPGAPVGPGAPGLEGAGPEGARLRQGDPLQPAGGRQRLS